MALQGRVCIVTGASRGIGKGIAVKLGEAGATVYITGRTLTPQPGVFGSLIETAEEVTNRGGKGIAVQCDHSKLEDIKNLFDRVRAENNSQLDLLVNNAYSAVSAITSSVGKKFYECPIEMWDEINNVGLRNHYFCSWYAAQMMVPRKQGLIIMISSFGGLKYLFNVPYGVGKEACDRMAADMGHELKKSNVTCISMWPGAVNTELIQDYIAKPATTSTAKVIFSKTESPEYVGKAVVGLMKDPKLIEKTGKVILTADLGDEYGFQDDNGTSVTGLRNVSYLLERSGYKTLAKYIPRQLKIPGWVVAIFGSKL